VNLTGYKTGAGYESPHNRSQARTLQVDFVNSLLICSRGSAQEPILRKMLNEDEPGNSATKDSVPIPPDHQFRLSLSKLTVAWPASTVFPTAPQKSPMIMTSRVTIGMMDCLNLMTAPFILNGAVNFRCKGEIERR
jgi:hypothetical protein